MDSVKKARLTILVSCIERCNKSQVGELKSLVRGYVIGRVGNDALSRPKVEAQVIKSELVTMLTMFSSRYSHEDVLKLVQIIEEEFAEFGKLVNDITV